MRAWGILVGSLLAAGCTRSAPPGPDGAPASPVVDCAHALEPMAGAVLLCDEHVMGADAEIHWRSYATREPRAAVNDRYREIATRCKLPLAADSKDFTLSRGDERLTTHDAAAGGYPACEKKPSASDATVIVVSTMAHRSP